MLIYCINQLVAALKGLSVSQTMRLKAHDLLVATNRQTRGEGYEALKAALEHLGGTRISTNIITGGEAVFENFGLIEKSKIVRETRDGRMLDLEMRGLRRRGRPDQTRKAVAAAAGIRLCIRVEASGTAGWAGGVVTGAVLADLGTATGWAVRLDSGPVLPAVASP